MLIYKKHILFEIALSFIVICCTMTGIIWITQTFKLMYLVEKGVSFGHFFGFMWLILPSLLFMILPFVTTLAVMYCYIKLTEERALIILKCSGLSNIQLAIPALIFAISTTLLAYYIAMSWMPSSYRLLKSEIKLVKDSYISNIINDKQFSNISKTMTLYIAQKTKQGELKGVVVFDHRKTDTPTLLFAKSAYLKNNNLTTNLQLHEGSRQAHDKHGNLTKLKFESLNVELSQKKDSENVSPENHNRDLLEYYLSELLSPHHSLSSLRQIKLIAEGHMRILWPLYNLLLPFVCLGVFLKIPYNRRTYFKKIAYTCSIALIATFCYFSLQNAAAANNNILKYSYVNVMLWIALGFGLYRRA